MKRLIRLLAVCFGFVGLTAAPTPLFDGKTLSGWSGDPKVWRVENGEIVGGSLQGNPRNEFLTTKRSFYNFRLTLEYKLVGTEGFVNAGVQFRSIRLANPPNEMSGYQADIGAGYSGALYDESRRKRFLAKAGAGVAAYGIKDESEIAKLEKPGEWNRYEIRAEGPRITIFLNGKATVDYTETDPAIDDAYGLIGLQIHGNNKAEVRYRNIVIDPLDDLPVTTRDVVQGRFGVAPPSTWVRPVPFKDGKFDLESDEVVVFIGQENLVREAKSGELESRLAAAYASRRPTFRSMAWQGDTVEEQWRDLNFGPWRTQLEAIGATTVFVQFGQAESVFDVAGVPAFEIAYHRLIDELSRHTPRLVLVAPVGFMKPAVGAAPGWTNDPERSAAYVAAIERVARARGLPFISLAGVADGLRSRDGLHLEPDGLAAVGRRIAESLGAPVDEVLAAKLRPAIVEKNRLWADCWRPANWSFVYGDRISQNYGKSFGPAPTLKQNFEAHKPLIAAWDRRIQALARGESSTEPAPQAEPVVSKEKLMNSAEEFATFKVAEGFEVTLYADEELGVAKPTQIAWDSKGRLYVCCSPSYPQAVPGVKPRDYILRLEDTKGVGRADKSVRFAEGLTMVQGVEPIDERNGFASIVVCDFDRLILLTDKDGDGKADATQVLLSGFGVGDTHQLVNSVCHGPDGKLWMTQGLHAFSRVETPYGVVSLPKSGVMSYDPRTQRLRPFFRGAKGGHNCWGVAFDDFFQPFHKNGDRVAGYYSLPGFGATETPDEYAGTHSLFDSALKSNSLDILGTQAMPPALQGAAVIGGYYGNTVDLHRFMDDGSGFRTERIVSPIVSSSKAFRPVDVSVGPDGAIYVCDWFNAVIGHYQASYADPRRDRSHGRIWRIAAKGMPAVKQPDLSAMDEAGLFAQLKSPERWTRYHARRLLFSRPTPQVLAQAFLALAERGCTDAQRLEVLAVLQAHGVAPQELIDQLLASQDFRVRAYATRAVAESIPSVPDAADRLAKSVRDPHPRVRLEAVVAMSHVSAHGTLLKESLRALDQPMDKFLDYALRQTVKELAAGGGRAVEELPPAQLAYVRKVVAPAKPSSPGQAIYESLCLNCHQNAGQGMAEVYPPLAKSAWVAGDEKPLIRVVMHGLAGPVSVDGKPYGNVPMPPMGLDDDQLAAVLTYVRSSFGNAAPPVKPETVRAVRDEAKGRTAPWTAAELGK